MMNFHSYVHEGRHNAQNLTDIIQRSLQIVAPDNIDHKDTWFTTDLKEDPRKTTSHKTSLTPYKK